MFFPLESLRFLRSVKITISTVDVFLHKWTHGLPFKISPAKFDCNCYLARAVRFVLRQKFSLLNYPSASALRANLFIRVSFTNWVANLDKTETFERVDKVNLNFALSISESIRESASTKARMKMTTVNALSLSLSLSLSLFRRLVQMWTECHVCVSVFVCMFNWINKQTLHQLGRVSSC